VDDGGDASLLVHKGYYAEENAELLNRKGRTGKIRLFWIR